MNQRERLFILQGNGPMRNRGCEAILRSTVSILREEFGPSRFINVPGYEVDYEKYEEPDPEKLLRVMLALETSTSPAPNPDTVSLKVTVIGIGELLVGELADEEIETVGVVAS